MTFLVKTGRDLKDKLDQLIPILKERKGPAIVYVTLQRQAEETALALRQAKLHAEIYHAGLKSEERKRVQDVFMESKDSIVSSISIGTVLDIGRLRMSLCSDIGCCNYRIWVSNE